MTKLEDKVNRGTNMRGYGTLVASSILGAFAPELVELGLEQVTNLPDYGLPFCLFDNAIGAVAGSVSGLYLGTKWTNSYRRSRKNSYDRLSTSGQEGNDIV